MRWWTAGLALLALCATPLSAFWWNSNAVTTTKAPPVAKEASTSGKALKKEDISDVGAEILDVASGIQKIVQNWDQNPTTGAPMVQDSVDTGNGKSLVGMMQFDSGSKRFSGSDTQSGIGSGSTVGLEQNGTAMAMPVESPLCLPRVPGWPICSSGGTGHFSLPNFLNHTRPEEVSATLNEWAWLVRSGCHHGVEWFFCLLLVPQCHSPLDKASLAMLPCRSFCEVLLDSCWTVLQERGLPVACHTLPEGQHLGRPCMVVSNLKGIVSRWCVLFVEVPDAAAQDPAVALLCLRFARAQTYTHQQRNTNPESLPTTACGVA